MTEYRLYGWRQTGSMAIEAALAEAGIAFEYIPISRKTDENRSAAFTHINPRQQLPALVLPDGTVVTEGPPILAHLADAHPASRLAPAPGSSRRATHDRWMAFFHANVYEAMLRQIKPAAYTTDPSGAAGIKAAADSYVERHFKIFETELGDGPYLFGDHLSMFDIYLWMLCYWMDEAWLVAHCPKIRRLQTSATARPHLARVADLHFG
jgi:glutathione S-transferase